MVEYNVKRKLTRPILKFEIGKPHHVRILGAFYIGRKMKTRDGEKDKEPATLANVVDLTTGEESQIIVNAVVKSVLTEEYPNDSYVGKCFSIAKGEKQPGKQYNKFDISEIDDPSESSAAPIGGVRRVGK